MERLTSRKSRISGIPGVCCSRFGGRDCEAVQGRCSDGCPWEETAWERLAAYEDTGVSPQELQGVVDLFAKSAKSHYDKEAGLKKWVERWIRRGRKCIFLKEKLDQTEIELINTRRDLGDFAEDLNNTETALEKAKDQIATMKVDLRLAASGHCCDICARKAECADTTQVTCCSAFQYYKTEE